MTINRIKSFSYSFPLTSGACVDRFLSGDARLSRPLRLRWAMPQQRTKQMRDVPYSESGKVL
jgi:hypothetical protein